MEFRRLCEDQKAQIAAALAAADSAMLRSEILIQALYDFSNDILSALGRPGRSDEYLQRQEMALGLVSYLGLALVKSGDRRGVAVLVEVGEGCADPLLKKKLGVYAQELLAKTELEPQGGTRRRPWLLLAGLATVLFVVSVGAVARFRGTTMPQTAVILEPPRPDTVFEAPPPAPVQKTGRAPSREAKVEAPPESAEDPVRNPEPAQPAAPVTKVRVINDQVLVPVTLKNRGESVTVELVLDTGATRTAIYETLAARLKMDLVNARTGRAELADGRVIPSTIARIDAVTVGPFTHCGVDLELFPYSGSDAPHYGLLGMDFLGKHKYQLDIENGLIHWL